MNTIRMGIPGDAAVMDFLRGSTDNEMAIVGCLVVLLGSAGMMVLSGTIFRRETRRRTVARVRGQAKRSVISRRAEERIA